MLSEKRQAIAQDMCEQFLRNGGNAMFYTMNDISDLHKALINGGELPDDFPYISALSESRQLFTIIREGRIDKKSDGSMTNFFANQEGKDDNCIACIIWNKFSGGTGFTSAYPIYDGFHVVSAEYEGETLILKSDTGKIAKFESFQLSSGSFELLMKSPYTMEELEKNFYEIQNMIKKEPGKKNSEKKKRSYISISGIGKLIYNDEISQFEIRRNSITFVIDDISSNTKMKKAKDNLSIVWNRQESFEALAKEFATKELLKTKNESWLEEGEKPLSENEFVCKMQLISVCADDKGIDMCFSDGDLFWGHDIVVSINEKGIPVFVNIEG